MNKLGRSGGFGPSNLEGRMNCDREGDEVEENRRRERMLKAKDAWKGC